jgi:hypothetical protein
MHGWCKDCLIDPLGCACTKQGCGGFAYCTMGLLEKIYID